MNTSTPSVETILEQAVEINEPGERQAFVEQACAGDHALKLRVEQLIANHFQAGSFLERPAAAIDRDRTAGWDAAISAAGPGTVIGPYKLLEELGEGGMGLVYVAEQCEPIKRRVALKIIKPGMDSRQVVARFEAERQALALMDHPHIAKVHDGGATPEGRPFFVMEFVKGAPVTEYCDEHRLTTRKRLALFIDVCHAVQHAHQKGIIHRDLKPSNVLVSVHDPGAPGVVKVIDFGIAKAIGGRLTDKTVYTTFAQMVGTPLYMSPEQAGLSDLDIDTRSDVYSLGVLLYELLTGTTPFDIETFKEAGYDEMRRMIREEEPPRPSTRLSGLEKGKLTTIGDHRGTDARKLNHEVRGELDWIAMKCLEKDRNRRYESASALATDVQRYLDDEPVQACPPSVSYRLRKFVRRHKVGLAVGAVLLLVLALAGAALWRELWQRAAAEASVAAALERADLLRQQERWQEASAVLAVAEGQLKGRGLVTLRQRVQQSRLDVDMLMSLEEARLQTSAAGQKTLWDYAGADRLYAQAFRRYGIDVASRYPEEAGRRIRASAIRDRLIVGLDDWASCRDEVSGPEARKALRALARLAGDDPWRQRLREAVESKDRAALQALAEQKDILSKPPASLVRLARTTREFGNWGLAEQLLRQAQALHPEDFWLNFELATTLALNKTPEAGQALRFLQAALALRPQSPVVFNDLGFVLRREGKLAEAEAAYRKSIALKPDDPLYHLNLGAVLNDQGRLIEAETAYRKAVALSPNEVHAYLNLGDLLTKTGKFAEADAACRRAIALRPEFADAYLRLGRAVAEQGRLVEAEGAYRKAIALEPNLGAAYTNLAEVLIRQGKPAEAERVCRAAVAVEPDRARAQFTLGNTLRMLGKLPEAEAAYRKAIALEPDSAVCYSNLAIVLQDQDMLAEAEAACRKAIALKPGLASAYGNLGNALWDQGKQVAAVDAYRTAVRLNPNLVPAQVSLANALWGLGDLEGAEAACRKALEVKPGYPRAHHNLGLVLRQQGRFVEALAELELAYKVGSREPGWSYPSEELINQLKRFIKLDTKLSEILISRTTVASARELIDLGELCRYKGNYATSARFFTQAFAAERSPADGLPEKHRYDAACAAALAGCGQGKDSARLDPKESSRLRGQAIAWLRAELKSQTRKLEQEPKRAGSSVVRKLRQWQQDPDFAGVRSADALAKLADAESQEWQQLWRNVDALERRAGAPRWEAPHAQQTHTDHSP